LFACFLVVMFFAWVFNSCLRFVVSINVWFCELFFCFYKYSVKVYK
jgi:hypothetical protein